jgi:hypothetical protein
LDNLIGKLCNFNKWEDQMGGHLGYELEVVAKKIHEMEVLQNLEVEPSRIHLMVALEVQHPVKEVLPSEDNQMFENHVIQVVLEFPQCCLVALVA